MNQHLLRNSLITVLALFAIVGCEDPLPEDVYIPELVVEGFVIADRPLNGIRVFRTLPITDTFRLVDAVLPDADVMVTENGTPIPVRFVADERGGSFEAVDTAYRVKYETEYKIVVSAIGKTASATAQTLGRFNWIAPPRDTLQYPGAERETERFDSLDVSWESQSIGIYVVAMECLDTTGYGEYLTPPTSDTNRRIRDEEPDQNLLINNEMARYGASFFTSTPVVWSIFRWFGPHRIHVYAGDGAFQEWFQQVGFGGRSTYDYRLSNIEGGLGVWAGASEVTSPIFLLKDKP